MCTLFLWLLIKYCPFVYVVPRDLLEIALPRDVNASDCIYQAIINTILIFSHFKVSMRLYISLRAEARWVESLSTTEECKDYNVSQSFELFRNVFYSHFTFT